MTSELLHESETVELKKSLAELKEGLVSIASFTRPSFLADAGAGAGQESTQKPHRNQAKTVDKTVDKLPLTVNERGLCRLVVAQPQLTQKQLAGELGLSERGVRYLTDKLQKQGVLARQGGKKAGRWVVLESDDLAEIEEASHGR